MTVKIITNNVPRDIIEGCMLTAKEREEFDYIDWAKVDAGELYPEFFSYKGHLYDLSFVPIAPAHSEAFKGWHGYTNDTAFSGIVIKFVEVDGDLGEYVVVGRWYYTSEDWP